MELRISAANSDGSMLSDAEFLERKQRLITEKDKLTEQLQNMNDDSEWEKIARESFDFALTASQRFQNGNTVERKSIVKGVGSNLILLDQILNFQPRLPFLHYKKGVKQTKAETTRLEPKNNPSEQANLENLVKSSIWYRVRESNP